MNTSLHYYRAGMGQTAAQLATIAGQGAATTATQIMTGSYVGAAGTALLTAAPFTGIAAPFVAIAGGVTELLGAIGIGKGCGQACIMASNYANQAEDILRNNLNTYLAQSPRYLSAQQAALNIFDQTWAGLVSVCSNPALNDAGKRCVTDRQRGSCAYKDSSGACWNWFIGYRDAIANDTTVVADPVSSLTTGLTSGSMMPILLMGGAAVVAFIAMQGMGE